jgi:hypothetical protein
MTYLLENPLPILVIGGLTLAILAGGWLKTGERKLAFAFIGAGVLLALLLLLERTVVTDREAVEATIHQIARDAEANDFGAMAGHFHSRASEMKAQLANEISSFRVERVSIKNNLAVEVSAGSEPRRTVATFNVVVTLSASSLGEQFVVPRFVTAYFELEDGRWRCTGYKHENPIEGRKKRDAEP